VQLATEHAAQRAELAEREARVRTMHEEAVAAGKQREALASRMAMLERQRTAATRTCDEAKVIDCLGYRAG
jgi:hypothetical protein